MFTHLRTENNNYLFSGVIIRIKEPNICKIYKEQWLIQTKEELNIGYFIVNAVIAGCYKTHN